MTKEAQRLATLLVIRFLGAYCLVSLVGQLLLSLIGKTLPSGLDGALHTALGAMAALLANAGGHQQRPSQEASA